MPSAVYDLSGAEALDLTTRIESWLKKNPPGSVISINDRKYEVTKRSKCSLDVGREYVGSCEIELQHEKHDMSFNLEVDYNVEGAQMVISDTDARWAYPDEFKFAKQELGLDFLQRLSWCFDLQGIRHCSAREVVGGGFSYQSADGPFSDPELWEKAKKKYPNDTHKAWRWYWDELKNV